jgi:hypothetical protein
MQDLAGAGSGLELREQCGDAVVLSESSARPEEGRRRHREDHERRDFDCYYSTIIVRHTG